MKKNNKGKKITQDLLNPIIIFLVMVVISLFTSGRSIITGPGITVPEAPMQSSAFGNTDIPHDSYNIKSLATYEFTAKIISKKTYNDVWSDICPIDFTLGWQHLSNEDVIRHINFSQRGRWTHYKYRNLPDEITSKDLISQCSNAHMCPANKKVRAKLLSLPKGAIVHIKGKLIALKHKKTDWHAKSSLKRTDTGDGACEIIWVEEIKNKT